MLKALDEEKQQKLNIWWLTKFNTKLDAYTGAITWPKLNVDVTVVDVAEIGRLTSSKLK